VTDDAVITSTIGSLLKHLYRA